MQAEEHGEEEEDGEEGEEEAEGEDQGEDQGEEEDEGDDQGERGAGTSREKRRLDGREDGSTRRTIPENRKTVKRRGEFISFLSCGRCCISILVSGGKEKENNK